MPRLGKGTRVDTSKLGDYDLKKQLIATNEYEETDLDNPRKILPFPLTMTVSSEGNSMRDSLLQISQLIMYHRNVAISCVGPSRPPVLSFHPPALSGSQPSRSRGMFLKEFDIEFFPSGACHQARELCFPGKGRKGARGRREEQRRRWRRVHYLEVERNPAALPCQR